jgi:hypothetical protein
MMDDPSTPNPSRNTSTRAKQKVSQSHRVIYTAIRSYGALWCLMLNCVVSVFFIYLWGGIGGVHAWERLGLKIARGWGDKGYDVYDQGWTGSDASYLSFLLLKRSKNHITVLNSPSPHMQHTKGSNLKMVSSASTFPSQLHDNTSVSRQVRARDRRNADHCRPLYASIPSLIA